jgi:hypothetical protein
MVAVKRRFDLDETFADMVAGMAQTQADYKSGQINTTDQELGLLLKFPGFVRRIIMAALRLLDRLGMLPPSFIRNDPMYCSAFFANMASLGMPPVYHHLYEYGTAGIFGSVGRPVAEPGSPTSGPERRRTMQIRWTFDERCDDGLAAWYALRRVKQVVEDPEGVGIRAEAVPGGAVEQSASEARVDGAALS